MTETRFAANSPWYQRLRKTAFHSASNRHPDAQGICLSLPPLRGKVRMGALNTNRARELRKNSTDTERALWKHLRLRQLGGYKFRRQQPIGQYIVDFVCLEKRLLIELDGGQHSELVDYDSARTAWLGAQGFRLLRFWNNQVLAEIDAVKALILRSLEEE